MTDVKKQIRVCDQHENKVPLIFTFSFPGSNYWCPHCGYTSRVMPKNSETKLTAPIEKLRDKNLEDSKEFLAAIKILKSPKAVMWNNVRTKVEDIPAEDIEALQEIVDSYKYGKKPKETKGK